MRNTLIYSIFAGLFLVPFIPFFITPSLLFPFIAGKAFAFRIITEIVFVLWLILALRHEEFRPKKSWVLIFFLAFLVLLGVSTVLSENPSKSFWSNFERMEGYITIIHLFLYFVVISSFLNQEKYWKRLFATWVGASAIMGFYGALQLSGKLTINQGGVRVDGTLGNATYLAVYMLVNIFFALLLFLSSKSKKSALWWFLPVFILDLVILYYTATRGAILGLVGGFIVTAIAFLIQKNTEKGIRKISWGVVIAILIVIVGFFAIKNTSFVENSAVLSRFSSLSAGEIKSQGRYYIWPMALEGIKERPIFGWGQESFNYIFNKKYKPELYAQEQWFDRAHSTPLDWAVAGGILGLLSYIGIFISTLFYLWKKDSKFSVSEKALFSGLLAAYFFQNIFVFDNLVSYILFITTLGFIVFRSESNALKFPRFAGSLVFRNVVAAILIVILAFTLYFANVKPILAGKNLINALKSLQSKGTSSEALEYYKKSLSYGTFANPEVREQLSQVADNFFTAGVPEQLQKDYFELANDELLKQIEETPKDARYYIFLGMFLGRAGLVDQALSAYAKAHELSPTKQSIYFDVAGIYFAQKKYKEAAALLKEAYELEPKYKTAKFLYAAALIYSGENKLADELLSNEPLADLAPISQILNAYAETGQYNKLLPILIERVRVMPSDAQSSYALAGAYLSVGQRQKAIEVLMELAAKNESVKDQVDFFVKEIQAGRNP